MLSKFVNYLFCFFLQKSKDQWALNTSSPQLSNTKWLSCFFNWNYLALGIWAKFKKPIFGPHQVFSIAQWSSNFMWAMLVFQLGEQKGLHKSPIVGHNSFEFQMKLTHKTQHIANYCITVKEENHSRRCSLIDKGFMLYKKLICETVLSSYQEIYV